tara:strand:- start:100 stop:327 length:228 start_codon:yes stop_codon:yes gene_type:complete
MDILLIECGNWTNIRPGTIHGMLWLQTHFEESEWFALANNQGKLNAFDTEELSSDAKEAGLSVNLIPAISTSRKS